MNRLQSKNTISELKDNYKRERKEIINSSKNYENQMNYQNGNNNMFSITPDYTNFLPPPENSRNNEIQQQKLDITKNAYDTHPKMMYLNNKNELLDNKINNVKYDNVDLKNMGKFNNSYNYLNTDNYIAEIGDKRKLSNIVFNSINKSFNVKEYEIEKIIEKISFNQNKWSYENTKQFVEELKKITNNGNISNENVSNIITQEENLFEQNTKEMEYYVTIDSNDRDTKIWKTPQSYQINFGPLNGENENIGYVNQSFNNVQSIELLEVIIPNNTNNGTNYETIPYISLEIPEIGNVFHGTNDNIRKTFSQLTFDKVVGNYRYCTFSHKTKIKKQFNPRIALNKMTINFLKPNGDIYDFGDYVKIINEDDNKDILSNNILTFKITCVQKSLDSMYINKN